jgi:hypothetical protein
LLGRGKLPEYVVVTAALWPYKKLYPMAMMPRADAGPGYRSYWFYFFGFIFLLALGKKIPAQQPRTSLAKQAAGGQSQAAQISGTCAAALWLR